VWLRDASKQKGNVRRKMVRHRILSSASVWKKLEVCRIAQASRPYAKTKTCRSGAINTTCVCVCACDSRWAAYPKNDLLRKVLQVAFLLHRLLCVLLDFFREALLHVSFVF